MGGRESAEEGENTRRIYSFLRLRLQLPTSGTGTWLNLHYIQPNIN